MELRTLFAGLVSEVPTGEVIDLTTDSREVAPGGLFVACAGMHHHGLDFLDEALAAGAAAVAWAPGEERPGMHLPAGVAGIRVPQLKGRLGDLADRFYAAPSAGMPVIGITGTNGKTTVAWLLVQALQRLAGPAGYMGTLGHGLGTVVQPDALTTPDCITVHRRLRALRDAGAACVVAEVSSHALSQGRVDGVRFHTVAFTNLSRDHLDYHGDLAAYGAAKARLFDRGDAAHAVINVGDAFGRTLPAHLPATTTALTVALRAEGAAPPPARLHARCVPSATGLTLAIDGEWGRAALDSPLWGRFNAENLLVATGILLAAGHGLAEACAALAAATAPPGRMQVVRTAAGATAVIDFAHTPDALRQAIDALRPHCAGRLHVVFGCGGDRDRGKRPLMGAVAVRHADRVVLTDDNPRGEDPRQIIDEILAGIAAPDRARVVVIAARDAAIRHALATAGPGDVVLVAGKGHEQTQVGRDGVRPFSDAAVVAAAAGQGA